MLIARLGRASCLERSLLRQAWLRERGARRDVVIGVRRENEFMAHAWLDGDRDGFEYTEMLRIPAEVIVPRTGNPLLGVRRTGRRALRR
jgi:Transglutaminase-like superfamily